MKLTEEDIQKIALYVPFKVRFAGDPFGVYCAKGIIGTLVIERWDEESHDLWDTSDISHPKNGDLPILRRLDKMVTKEYKQFESLAANQPQITKYENLSFQPDLMLYALQNHFDIFGLIDQGKAIDMDAERFSMKP